MMTRMFGFFCCAHAGPATTAGAMRSASNASHVRRGGLMRFLLAGASFERRGCPLRSLGCAAVEARSGLEREDPLPVLLHADDGPALLPRLVVQRLGERADSAGRQPGGRAVGVLPPRVVVEQEHRQPRAVAGPRVLEHLPVT